MIDYTAGLSRATPSFVKKFLLFLTISGVEGVFFFLVGLASFAFNG